MALVRRGFRLCKGTADAEGTPNISLNPSLVKTALSFGFASLQRVFTAAGLTLLLCALNQAPNVRIGKLEIQMQKVLFIIGLEKILTHNINGRGVRLKNSMFLTNDHLFIKSLLSSSFVAIAGEIEYDFLLSTRAVIYSIEECEVFTNSNCSG